LPGRPEFCLSPHVSRPRPASHDAGFYGIPLADLVFGTYKRPLPLLLDDVLATNAAARALSRQPRWRLRGSIASRSNAAAW
jgi:hypothetical protein